MVVTEIESKLGFEIDHCFGSIYSGNIPTDFNAKDKYRPRLLLTNNNLTRYLSWALKSVSKKAITRKLLDENPPTNEEQIAIVKYMFDMEKHFI